MEQPTQGCRATLEGGHIWWLVWLDNGYSKQGINDIQITVGSMYLVACMARQ